MGEKPETHSGVPMGLRSEGRPAAGFPASAARSAVGGSAPVGRPSSGRRPSASMVSIGVTPPSAWRAHDQV